MFVRQRRCREPDIAGFQIAELNRRGSVADHRKLVALEHAGNSEVMRRPPRPEQQIDLVLYDELFVDLGRLARIGLIVIGDEFDHPFGPGDVEAALGVDLVAPQLIGILLRRRRRRENAGDWQREADPNGIRRLGGADAKPTAARIVPHIFIISNPHADVASTKPDVRSGSRAGPAAP